MTTYSETLSDNIAVSGDTTSLKESLSITTRVDATDSISTTNTFIRSTVDNITLTENFTGGFLYSETISDSFSLSEISSGYFNYSDDISVSEILSLDNVFKKVSDSFIISDSMVFSNYFKRTNSDSFYITNTLNGNHFRDGKLYQGIRVKELSIIGP